MPLPVQLRRCLWLVVYLAVGYQVYTFTRGYISSGPLLDFSKDVAIGSGTEAWTSASSGSLGAGVETADGRRSVSRRTVAVADLHGDFEHALNVLRMALLISGRDSSWVAGHDVLVSTGDIVDRGDDTIRLYRLFGALRSEAEAQGGAVHNLLGNHEMMNALGDWRYVTPGDVDSFGGPVARRKAMSDKGWIGQDWIQAFNVTASVPLVPVDHPHLPRGYRPPHVSFVHGGITPEYAKRGTDAINTIGKSLLTKALQAERPNGWLPDNTTEEEQHLWGQHGPLWYRGYATEPDDVACSLAEEATRALGVEHLVMGQ